MKAALITVFLFYCQFLLSQDVWKNIGPGGGSDLKSIAIHPENPDIVYVGGDIEGIFKTTNGGNSWQNINSNLPVEYSDPGIYFVQEIIFDYSDPTFQTLYICTSIGLFKTENGGGNWTLLFPKNPITEEDFIPISYLVSDPEDPNKIWIGTGVAYPSEDGTGKIIYSSDGGNVWSELQIISNTGVIQGLVIDPLSSSNSRVIYTSTNEGVYKSTNNGINWENKSNGLPHNETRRIKGIIQNNKFYLFLTLTTFFEEGNPDSFKGGIFKSEDGAETWIDITNNLPKYQEEDSQFYFYWKFTIDKQNPNTIYIGTSRGWPDESYSGWEEWGIYKTVDGGNNWANISDNINYGWMNQDFYEDLDVFVLELAPSNPNIIYWGMDWILKSSDAGESWTQKYTLYNDGAWQTTGLELMVVDGLNFDPFDYNIMYVGYDDFGFFRSMDGGTSFKPLDESQDPFDGPDGVKDIEIDPDNGDLYISRWGGLADGYDSDFSNGMILKSSDKGDSFDILSNQLPQGTPKLLLDKISGSSGNRVLYCSIYHHGVYKSTDSGLNWFEINNGLNDDAEFAWEISINPSNPQNLYLGLNTFGQEGGLYKSSDSGNNWSKIFSFPNYDVLSIEVDNNESIFVGATDNYDYNFEGGLYKSTDFGNSWNEIFDNSRISDIQINPTNSNNIFIVSQGWYIWNESTNPGIFHSIDGGDTWANITENLGNTFIHFIKLHPNNFNVLYAGSDGGGLWYWEKESSAIKHENNLKLKFGLSQNYPNPFGNAAPSGNSLTTIEYTVPAVKPSLKADTTDIYYSEKRYLKSALHIIIKVFDILGREVTTLADKEHEPGNYKIVFDAAKLSNGIYFYVLYYENIKLVRKMILLR